MKDFGFYSPQCVLFARFSIEDFWFDLPPWSFQEFQFKTVVQKVIDDISEMSTEKKILYIENSIHFTVDQKNAIKFEFLFDGYSRTLTSLANQSSD